MISVFIQKSYINAVDHDHYIKVNIELQSIAGCIEKKYNSSAYLIQKTIFCSPLGINVFCATQC